MIERGVIDAAPAVRVSFGGETAGEGRDVVAAARETRASVRVAAVGPTGARAVEPLVTATTAGRTAFFPRCTPEEVRHVVESVDADDLPEDAASAAVDHDPGAAGLPTPETGPIAAGERRVLGACGWCVPTSEADYEARGEKLVHAWDGDELIGSASERGLRGRGRGDSASDVPVAEQWKTARSAEGTPLVVVNANEADPRSTADALLLESDPFAVLDPALAVADAIGASGVVVYVNETDERPRRAVSAAAAALDDSPPRGVTIEVCSGPDEYKAGEVTMALEALEGNDRLEARRRPPGPARYGLFGRPTVVHTPRTLAQLRRLATGGAVGADADPGTRLFDVSGDVAAHATVELPTHDQLSSLLDAVETTGRPKAACVGGVFGGLTESLQVPANAEALSAAGLGTNGAVEVFDRGRCPVAVAGRRAKFARAENCGRCVPCREGTKQLTDLLRGVYGGETSLDDVRELVRVIDRSSLCGFGPAAARPVTTALRTFEPEFVAHAEGDCPAGECER